MNKTRCSYPDCTNEEEMLPFKCKLCEKYYCSKHRLPEQHECSQLNYFQSDEYKKSKIGKIPSSISISTHKGEKKEKPLSIDKTFGRKERTASYLDKRDRFLARSAFFTLYVFEKNVYNVLLSTLFISTILSLFFTVNLTTYKSAILIILPMIFIGIGLTYAGHEAVHHFVGKRLGVRTQNALWLQAFLVSLLSIVFPILILPPSLLILKKSLFTRRRGKNIFQLSGTDYVKKEYGTTALAGVIWLISWEIIAVVFTLMRGYYPISTFTFALSSFSGSLVVFLFGFLVFHSLPLFPLSDGNYIFEWNRKLAWGLWVGNIVIYFVYIILNSVFY